MKNVMQFAAIGALAAGMALAQAPASPPSGSPQAGVHNGVRSRIQQQRAKIAQELNLTDAQRQQAKTIFQQARETAKPVREQLRANRQALAAAVKADQSAEIQQLATARGNLMGQMTAIRAEASAKFYHTLTPEQRAKADQMHSQFRQQMRERGNQRSNG
jgi:Spy/CpxP family protein refolding chaperone